MCLEKHLRKEKYAQNNLESHSRSDEVRSRVNSVCLSLVSFGAGTPKRRFQAQKSH